MFLSYTIMKILINKTKGLERYKIDPILSRWSVRFELFAGKQPLNVLWATEKQIKSLQEHNRKLIREMSEVEGIVIKVWIFSIFLKFFLFFSW